MNEFSQDVGNESDDGLYSTRDLTLAATLVTLKFSLEGFDVQYEGSKYKPVAYFKFPISKTLNEAKKKFLQGLLVVEPKTFMLNIRSLKSEIENLKKNPHDQG